MASIPLKSWELLIRAAEIGSVQQAAENLELDPTTAGRMLGKLEQWLGRSLYVRRMRPFTLTEAGRAAVERMRPVLASYHQVELGLRRDSSELHGLIRISAAGGYASQKLIPEIMKFSEIYPEVDFDISVARTVRDLKRDAVDIALVTDRPDEDGLVSFWRDHSVFIPIASPEYLTRFGRPQHPSDLASHTGFCYTGPVREPASFLEKDASRSYFKWKKRITVSDILAVKNAVLEGYGCAVDMPIVHCYREIEAGDLVPILSGWRVPTRELFAVTTEEKYGIRRIRTFLDWYVPRSVAAGRLRDRKIAERIGLLI